MPNVRHEHFHPRWAIHDQSTSDVESPPRAFDVHSILRILQPTSDRDAMDYWPIEIGELSPGISIARVFDLNNQTFTRFGKLCHGDLKRQENWRLQG